MHPGQRRGDGLRFTARMLRKYGPRLAVGVDLKDGRAPSTAGGRPAQRTGLAFCRRLADAGCTAVIVTDIARDGAMQGTNLELYRRIRQELPGLALTASGGIRRMEELDALDQMGAAAAILGKSLYAGALDLAACVRRYEKKGSQL